MKYAKAVKYKGTCRCCGHNISASQQYAEWHGSGYTTPRLHKECVDKMSAYFKNNQTSIERNYKNEIAKIKAAKDTNKKKMKAVKEKRAFKQAILKEALKSIDICVSKISITNPNDWGLYGTNKVIKVAPKSKSQWQQAAFFFAVQNDTTLTIYKPVSVYDGISHSSRFSTHQIDKYKEFTEVQLADPDAFKKVGQAILKHHMGDLTPYYKKVRSK